MKRILLLISFVMIAGISFGQDSLRKFDEQKWKEIVGDVTFEEDPEEEPEPKRKEADEGSGGFSLPPVNPHILQVISFVVVFILFAFILYYVSRNTSLSQGIKSMKLPDAATPVENIDDLDVEALLRNALASGDLRLAVRVHYLLLLKKLNEAGLIAWKKDKTNREYLSELYNRINYYDDISRLTLAYELVWYGERSVTSDSFQSLSGSFESVNRKITQAQSTT